MICCGPTGQLKFILLIPHHSGTLPKLIAGLAAPGIWRSVQIDRESLKSPLEDQLDAALISWNPSSTN
jgi:hypothetical protein